MMSPRGQRVFVLHAHNNYIVVVVDIGFRKPFPEENGWAIAKSHLHPLHPAPFMLANRLHLDCVRYGISPPLLISSFKHVCLSPAPPGNSVCPEAIVLSG